MGLFDKIKNALFEEEYVEVEEKPKKPKKEISKSRDVERPIAKKVVLPEKKEPRVEELDEDELLDEDFEINPSDSNRHAEDRKSFKVMDDDDFKVDDEISHRISEPKIVKVIDQDETEILDEARFYKNKKDRNEKSAYGINESNKVNMPEYGNNKSSYDSMSYGNIYEKKEDRTHFKPSPIISPIYGILDKNYKKEDVVTKKEIRLTSSYARENLSVEDVRKKAYGSLSDDIAKGMDEEPVKKASFEVEEKVDEDANLLVDLSDTEEKPAVKEVTMGDALEYFEDLGLEYNVDYVDATKKAPIGRRTKESYDEEESPEIISKVKESQEDKVVEKLTEKKEVQEITPKVDDSDDNLFDLIDSMYKEND